MEFKKFTGEKVDLVDYVRNYVKLRPNTEILVGCDSQNRGGFTSYAVIVALYDPGHGAHVIYKRERTPRERVRATRLLNEVYRSIETAKLLRENGMRVKYIDIDVNPNPRYKSNEVYNAAKGWVEGEDFECRYKTLAPLCTTMADYMARR